MGVWSSVKQEPPDGRILSTYIADKDILPHRPSHLVLIIPFPEKRTACLPPFHL